MFALFIVFFEFLCWCIDTILNSGESSFSFFSWHLFSVSCIVINSLVFWSICICSLPNYLKNVPEYLTSVTVKVFYSFDEISVAGHGFEKPSCSSEELFPYFFFHLYLFDDVRFLCSKELIIFPLLLLSLLLLLIIILPTPPLGQDMTQGQFFKRSLTGFNSEFSFSLTSCFTKAEEPNLPNYFTHS